MEVVTRIALLRATLAERRRAGQRLAFVPTMGNLHAGHMSLLSAARFRADRVVASIFVNPLQFGPADDFLRYPRTPTEDSLLLTEAGCDLLFAPTVEQIYPDGGSQPRSTDTTRISMMPSQNVGVDNPASPIALAT